MLFSTTSLASLSSSFLTVSIFQNLTPILKIKLLSKTQSLIYLPSLSFLINSHVLSLYRHSGIIQSLSILRLSLLLQISLSKFIIFFLSWTSFLSFSILIDFYTFSTITLGFTKSAKLTLSPLLSNSGFICFLCNCLQKHLSSCYLCIWQFQIYCLSFPYSTCSHYGPLFCQLEKGKQLLSTYKCN